MPLSTALANKTLVLGDQLIFGTCMLGSAFGQIKTASLKRTADRELIANCHGNLRAVLLKNPRFELVLKTVFDSTVTAPGLMEEITLPLVAVTARIMDVSVEWDENGERMLSIEASHWDALAAASAYTNTAGTYALLT
jgi:hypothetical protein